MSKLPIVVFLGDSHCLSDTGLAKPDHWVDSKDRYYPMSANQEWLYECWTQSVEFIKQLSVSRSVVLCFGGDAVDGVMHHKSTQTYGTAGDQRDMAVELYKEPAEYADEIWFRPGTASHVGDKGDEDRSVCKRIGGHIADYEQIEIAGKLLDWAHHGISMPRDPSRQEEALVREARYLELEALYRHERIPDMVVRHHVHVAPPPVKVHNMWISVCPAFQMPTYFVNGFNPTGISSIGHLVWDPIGQVEPELKVYDYRIPRATSKFATAGQTANPADLDEADPESLTATWGTDDQS